MLPVEVNEALKEFVKSLEQPPAFGELSFTLVYHHGQCVRWEVAKAVGTAVCLPKKTSK